MKFILKVVLGVVPVMAKARIGGYYIYNFLWGEVTLDLDIWNSLIKIYIFYIILFLNLLKIT